MKDKKISHPSVAQDQEGRPAYKRPVVIPLGELVQGSGNCVPGSSPTGTGGNCKAGGTARQGNCINGTRPGINCVQGATK